MRQQSTATLFAILCSVSAKNAVVDPVANTEWLVTNKESNEDVIELPSGLQYKVLQSGDPTGVRPNAGDKCTCHYEGALIDGSVFDGSRKRGNPATFSPNGVIPGWTEALQLMKEGDKWRLFVPQDMAYGASPRPGGPIEPYCALVFEVELISVALNGKPVGEPEPVYGFVASFSVPYAPGTLRARCTNSGTDGPVATLTTAGAAVRTSGRAKGEASTATDDGLTAN